VIAFILVPANQIGPRKDLLNILNNVTGNDLTDEKMLTHSLHDIDYDPVIRRTEGGGNK
jgi:hypothetical protein